MYGNRTWSSGRVRNAVSWRSSSAQIRETSVLGSPVPDRRPEWSASCPGARCDRRYRYQRAHSIRRRSPRWPRPRSAPAASARPPTGRVRVRRWNGVTRSGDRSDWDRAIMRLPGRTGRLPGRMHDGPTHGQGADATRHPARPGAHPRLDRLHHNRGHDHPVRRKILQRDAALRRRVAVSPAYGRAAVRKWWVM